MDSNVKMKYIELLKKEISPALGCTEPAAVALCAAGAAALLDQKVKNVVIQVSSYILKNGMNVGIPAAVSSQELSIASMSTSFSFVSVMSLRLILPQMQDPGSIRPLPQRNPEIFFARRP